MSKQNALHSNRAIAHFLPQHEGAAVGGAPPPQQPAPALPSAGAGRPITPPFPPASQPAQSDRRLLWTPLQQQHLPLPAPQVPCAPARPPPARPPSSSSSSSLLSLQQAHLKGGPKQMRRDRRLKQYRSGHCTRLRVHLAFAPAHIAMAAVAAGGATAVFQGTKSHGGTHLSSMAQGQPGAQRHEALRRGVPGCISKG